MTPNPSWPNLPLAEWADTCDTLHLWMQVVGKVRMVLAPLVNHWWNVTLYVTSRGLTTSPIPCGARTFEILNGMREVLRQRRGPCMDRAERCQDSE